MHTSNNTIVSREFILNHVFPRLRPQSHDEVVKVSFLDLEIQYYVKMDTGDGYEKSFRLTSEIMEANSLSLQTIAEHAIRNLNNHIISEPLSHFIPVASDDEDLPMFVLTTDTSVNGAAAILCTEHLEQLANKLHEDDLYILPSSIHEALVIPSAICDVEGINNMICSINDSIVEPEERLSNHLYRYSTATGISQ